MKSIRNTYLFTYPHENWNIYAYLHSIKPLLPRSLALPLANIDYLSTSVEASVGCMCACLSGPILHDSIYFVCKAVSRLCVNANQGICLHIKIRSFISFFFFFLLSFFFFFSFFLSGLPSFHSFVWSFPLNRESRLLLYRLCRILKFTTHLWVPDSLQNSCLQHKRRERVLSNTKSTNESPAEQMWTYPNWFHFISIYLCCRCRDIKRRRKTINY